MDKDLIELLERIRSDKELTAAFSSSLETGKHLNITGLCAEQKVYVAMALARLNGRKAVFIEPDSARARATASYCSAFTDGQVITCSGTSPEDIENISLMFDFGTCPEGSVVISDIMFAKTN